MIALVVIVIGVVWRALAARRYRHR
jgi:hypothetical protein